MALGILFAVIGLYLVAAALLLIPMEEGRRLRLTLKTWLTALTAAMVVVVVVSFVGFDEVRCAG